MLYSIIRYYVIPVFISFVILYLCCFIPANDIPEVSFDFFIAIDKIVHFSMYLGLSGAVALNYIYVNKGLISVTKLLIIAFLIPILYGGLIEILQHCYFPPRSGDWFDFLADVIGSLAALPIAFVYKKICMK